MRHRNHTFKIGRTSAHRRAMMANMACSLFLEGQIRTTLTRAKELRRIAERMITLGKDGSLHARRRAISILGQKPAVRLLFAEIAPRYTERQGGYTRILKLGKRLGDAAETCLVQLVTEPLESKATGDNARHEAVAVTTTAADTDGAAAEVQDVEDAKE